MMTKNVFIPFIIVLVLWSCSGSDDEVAPLNEDEEEQLDKEEEEDDKDNPQVSCLMTEMKTKESDGDVISGYFKYDSAGKIIQIKEVEEWVENDVNKSHTEYYNFTYEGDVLIKMLETREDESIGQTVTISYSDKNVSVIHMEDDEGYIQEYRFIYSEAMLKIENWTLEGQEFQLAEHKEYTFSDENLVKIEDFEPDSSTASEKTVITFEDSKNPFKGNLAYYLWMNDAVLFLSDNNPGTITETDLDSEPANVYTDNFTYQYDESDNLIGKILKGEGDYQNDISYKYSCE